MFENIFLFFVLGAEKHPTELTAGDAVIQMHDGHIQFVRRHFAIESGTFKEHSIPEVLRISFTEEGSTLDHKLFNQRHQQEAFRDDITAFANARNLVALEDTGFFSMSQHLCVTLFAPEDAAQLLRSITHRFRAVSLALRA